MSNKIVIKKNNDGSIVHWCPGCVTCHKIYVDCADPENGLQWVWNGDYLKPTLVPAKFFAAEQHEQTKICHYVLHFGQITYLQKTTHDYAGKSLSLECLKQRAIL